MNPLPPVVRLMRTLTSSAAVLAALAVLMLALGPAAEASAATATTQKSSGANGQAKGQAKGQYKSQSSSSDDKRANGEARGAKNRDGNAGTSGDSSTPQPESNADRNSGGANGQCGEDGDGPYCSTRDGSASQNGQGKGASTGKPCAGCVGKADNKNPKGQEPGPSDRNKGYECDGNKGIGKGNPAHTGCAEGEGGTDSPENPDGENPEGENPDGVDNPDEGSDSDETCPAGQMADEDGDCEPMTVSPICPLGEMSDTEGDCVEVTETCTDAQEAAGECRAMCPEGQMDDTEGGCTEVVVCEDQEQMESGAGEDVPCVEEAPVVVTGSTPGGEETPSTTPGSEEADQGVLSSGETRDAAAEDEDSGSDADAGMIQRASDAVAGALPNTGSGWAVLIAGLLGIAAIVGGWRVLRSR